MRTGGFGRRIVERIFDGGNGTTGIALRPGRTGWAWGKGIDADAAVFDHIIADEADEISGNRSALLLRRANRRHGYSLCVTLMPSTPASSSGRFNSDRTGIPKREAAIIAVMLLPASPTNA